MNAQYLRNDLCWDLDMFLAKANYEHRKVSYAIVKFEKSLEKIKSESAVKSNEGEIIAEIEISEEWGKDFIKAMTNAQNENFYNSVFVMACSFIEFSIAELCRVIQPYLKGTIEPYYNYKGLGYNKSQNYLREALDIEINKLAFWSEFKTNIKVRNCIVHNSGNIMFDYEREMENQPDYRLVAGNRNFELTETGYIFINNIEYIKAYNDKLWDFILEVFGIVKSKL